MFGMSISESFSKLGEYLKNQKCYVSYMDYYNDSYRIAYVNTEKDEVLSGSGKTVEDAIIDLVGKL